jgi:hypothetical protein
MRIIINWPSAATWLWCYKLVGTTLELRHGVFRADSFCEPPSGNIVCILLELSPGNRTWKTTTTNEPGASPAFIRRTCFRVTAPCTSVSHHRLPRALLSCLSVSFLTAINVNLHGSLSRVLESTNYWNILITISATFYKITTLFLVAHLMSMFLLTRHRPTTQYE